MPEKRSESDIVLKLIRLKFGDVNYDIPVLRMTPAAIWRRKYFEETADVSASMFIDDTVDKAQMARSVGNALTVALLKFPEKIPELVFSYAPSLLPHRDKIEEDAYDMDFAHAFGEIYKAAFAPFLAALGTVLEMQRAQESRSPSSAN